MKISGRSIFSLVIIVAMIIFVTLSLNFNSQARLFPLVVGSITLIMAILQFLGDSVPAVRRRFPFLTQEGIFSEDKKSQGQENQGEQNEPTSESSSWGIVSIIVLCIIGFIILLHYTSYLLAVPVFLFIVIYFLGKEKIFSSLGIAGVMTVFMYVLFDLILNARF